MVKIEDLTVKYPDGTTAVDNITMNINDGEHLALIGANGAGKSSEQRFSAPSSHSDLESAGIPRSSTCCGGESLPTS